jgi:hypothetical protein
MKKDSYKCYLGNGHDSSVLTYPADPANAVTCKTYPLLKRIEIYGQTNSFTYGGIPKMICYKIGELENAQDTGESFHFNMRVFDTVSKKILYKSAGNLNYPSTLILHKNRTQNIRGYYTRYSNRNHVK